MNIIKGKQQKPVRAVIYGPEGIGKSTFASQFPNPLFIDTEDSTTQLDVDRIEKPNNWKHLIYCLTELNANHMDYKTLIVDTIDWAEQMCIESVCEQHKKEGIEEFGYGKGYTYVQEAWMTFLNFLTDMRENGLNIVLVAHAHMRKFEQPDELGAYDRWELKLTKKCSPVTKEWADMVLFANYKTMVVDVNGKKKAQGGNRVMYTSHHPCWDAKNRHGLDNELKFEYAAIAHLFNNKNKPVDPPKSNENQKRPLKTDLTSYPDKLWNLMTMHGVEDEDIRKVVAKKGYYSEATSIGEYEQKFVDDVLVGAWDQVYEEIKKTKGE